MSKVIPFQSIGNVAIANEAAEPRSAPRRRMLKGGTICFNERHSTLPCAVRDVSEEGARLRISGSIDAPDTFELFIELDGIWVECEVVWRGRGEIGVRFTSERTKDRPSRTQVLQQQHSNPGKPSLRRKPKKT